MPAQRICSLLPSATEIVFALGLGDRLVAVTHECDHPAAAVGLPVVTGAGFDPASMASRDIHIHVSESLHRGSSIYTLDQSLLESLRPDLVLTQELCDVCAVSYSVVQEAVRTMPGGGGAPTVLSMEPTSLQGILDTVTQVGAITGTEGEAARVVSALQARIDAVAQRAQGAAERPRVFTMEWMDPPFAGGHWVPEMTRLAGGTPGLVAEGVPSREVSWEEIAAFDPEIVIVMPCGFHLDALETEFRLTPFPAAWGELEAVRRGQVYGVDATAYFSRPGPRAVDGLEALAEIVHPELFSRRLPPSAWRPLELRDCEQ